jgi:hypothetical protein
MIMWTKLSRSWNKGRLKKEKRKKELGELLRKWAFRNYGRAGFPFVVGVLGMMNFVMK